MSDDLTAIFGSSVRAPDDLRHRQLVPVTKRSRIGPAALAITLGAIALVIVGGFIAGRNAIGRQFGVASPAVRQDLAPPVSTATTSATSRVADRTAVPLNRPSEAASVAVATVAPPTIDRPREVTQSSPGLPMPSPSVAVTTQQPEISVQRVVPTGPPPMGGRNGDGDGNGNGQEPLPSRLDLAEQRFANAFEHAAAAGVAPGILRDYRRGWDQARREAARQPRDALRLYAIMTSALLEIADDGDTIDRGDER